MDLLLKTTKVVTTMVTKRPYIPVAQIDGLSGMMYIQIDIHMHIIHYGSNKTLI